MKNNDNRFRCLTSGCNPKLYGQESADGHKKETGHRTVKWPVRSSDGERKARERNKNGYYDKYNVGAKSAVARGLVSTGSSELDLFDRLLSQRVARVSLVSDGEDMSWWEREEDVTDYEDFEDPGF